jgi:SAM-dependent methyltransferase
LDSQLEYGNWIRIRILVILGLSALGAAALNLLPMGNGYHLILWALFTFLLISFLIPFYSYIMFSQYGGRFQEKLYDLIIHSLGEEVTGRILDIGSGNGVLAVKLALRHPGVNVVGMDYWGKDWEYSKKTCEKNAQSASVDSRVTFQKGDAATLDFPPASFDGAISNLTFHEVRSVSDKRLVLKEALRVVNPGGKFAFVDYFYDDKYYGKEAEFEQFLQDLKLSRIERKHMHDVIQLPILLKHPNILGKVGIIFGEK